MAGRSLPRVRPRMPASITRGCMLKPPSAIVSQHHHRTAITTWGCMLRPLLEVIDQHRHRIRVSTGMVTTALYQLKLKVQPPRLVHQAP